MSDSISHIRVSPLFSPTFSSHHFLICTELPNLLLGSKLLVHTLLQFTLLVFHRIFLFLIILSDRTLKTMFDFWLRSSLCSRNQHATNERFLLLDPGSGTPHCPWLLNWGLLSLDYRAPEEPLDAPSFHLNRARTDFCCPWVQADELSLLKKSEPSGSYWPPTRIFF